MLSSQDIDLNLVNNEKQDSESNSHLSLADSIDNTRRRSSNRSIKRRKFDDELVEYSLGLPGVSTMKSSRSRTQSLNTSNYEYYGAPTPVTPPAPPATPSTSFAPEVKRKHVSKSSSGSSKRKKGRQQNQIATKDLGRWKPTDDLALIIGVQQTNDLRTVHLGTKFSCKFTVQELQQRWYALLYDKAVSRIAVAAMRNLHPDMIANVQDKALWSAEEEKLLAGINSSSNPNLSVFADLLVQHPEVFYPSRTALALQRHWHTMRLYHLLRDQTPQSLPTASKPVLTFSDAEDLLQDSELSEPHDEILDRELRLQQRLNAKEIRHLENEIGRWNVLVDSVTGICPGEMDSQTLAVLRGRLVRYLMRSREITIGRSAKGHAVDIDLSLEGPAEKISRKQGTLRLRNTGEFYLSSEGKRPIFVDGRPIMPGNKVRLNDNSVVEIASLRFIFSVNQELIKVIHNESVRFNLPP
ncbi:microspherule protein 1 [Agrilus planipennis]|uniref:Microspherule protein 1 n=1 Tax=Agrilus planipennis TaxID=224129 RepID=A0A1W4XHL8_AGRPL|nr:microspherule protein 1 [Agrilus planipennis]